MGGACPAVQAAFRRSVNMTPGEIRAWARDPRARCASWGETRRRLPGIADLKEKPAASWTAADCSRAQRVVNFNTRMSGLVAVHGCTAKAPLALRNWGRKVACALPASCPSRRG